MCTCPSSLKKTCQASERVQRISSEPYNLMILVMSRPDYRNFELSALMAQLIIMHIEHIVESQITAGSAGHTKANPNI